MKSNFSITIYGLIDPANPDEIVYVGATRDLRARLESHKRQRVYETGEAKVGRWVASLKDLGCQPSAVSLAMTTLEHADSVESALMESLNPKLNLRRSYYSSHPVHGKRTRRFPNGTPR